MDIFVSFVVTAAVLYLVWVLFAEDDENDD